jgi:DNA-binding response OmpR family regulator
VQNDLVVIMVVEDDQLIQGVVQEALSEGGFETAIATMAKRQLRFCRTNKPGTGR